MNTHRPPHQPISQTPDGRGTATPKKRKEVTEQKNPSTSEPSFLPAIPVLFGLTNINIPRNNSGSSLSVSPVQRVLPDLAGFSTPKKWKGSQGSLSRGDVSPLLSLGNLAMQTPPHLRLPVAKTLMGTSSPFKGDHAKSYEHSVNAISNMLDIEGGEAKESKHSIVTTVDIHNEELLKICEFMSDFWSDNENLKATQAAYTERNQAMYEVADDNRQFLLEAIEFFNAKKLAIEKCAMQLIELSTPFMHAKILAEIKMLLASTRQWVSLHNERCKDWKKLGAGTVKELAGEVTDGLDMEIDEEDEISNQIESTTSNLTYIAQSIDEGMKAIQKQVVSLEKKQNAISQKSNVIADPLCVSFAFITNKNNATLFCLVSISSPEKNKALYDLLFIFIENSHKYRDVFQLSEAPSRDFQKLMLSVGGMLGDPLPRHAYRECAEKSCTSTLSKLSQHLNTELEIKTMYNTAFYPVVRQAYEAASNVLRVNVKQQEYEVKLIPPCDDCKHRMEADRLILKSANNKIMQTSPLKFLVPSSSSSSSSSSSALGVESRGNKENRKTSGKSIFALSGGGLFANLNSFAQSTEVPTFSGALNRQNTRSQGNSLTSSMYHTKKL